MLAAFAWLSSHWLPAVILLALLFVIVLCPEFVAAALRWLIGTEWGRYLLLATLVVAWFLWLRGHWIAEGRAAVLAEQAATADRARADAATAALGRDTSAQVIGDKAQAQTAAHIETGQKATTAAQERTHVRIVEVPAVGGCAGPDAGVMRDVQASAARVRAAADRMRGIGAAPAR
jgi:hypothetical protein